MRKVFLMLLVAILATTSCKIYKFTGASVTAETVSIGNFPNLAPIQASGLSDAFIDNLRDKVLRETRLRIATPSIAEVQFTGSIVDYYVSPVTVTGTETIARNRLTIVVQLDYIDTTDPEKSFSQRFQDGENYEGSQSLVDVQDVLIEVITERISESIFNRAFVNW
ncbi:MAG: hypothetical protein GY751_04050 [Bacteroidetes bacterium]|nr:hypothetical protein [Bacteroidota bacterium]